MKKAKHFKQWRQQYPPGRINRHLRQLLMNYIDFFPENAIPAGFNELVSDITALMELLDGSKRGKYYVK